MSKQDISKYVLKIEDADGWSALIAQSESKLVIVDCHQDWCGPCEAMQPTFQRIFTDYDNCEDRVVLATASIGKVGSVIQTSFPSDCQVSLEKNGCLPSFALYRFKACVGVIVGVDAPTLAQQINVNIPDKPSRDNQD